MKDVFAGLDVMAVWRDSVWFITGASSGFGRALALRVLAEGGRVVAASRNPGSLEELTAGVTAEVMPISLDLTRDDQIQAAVAAALLRFGRIDVLVNAAGYGLVGSIEESSNTEIDELFAVNFHGAVRLIRAVLPGMRERRHGYVVNFSSLVGVRPVGGTGLYAATKFAIEGMSEALHHEVESLGIRVLIVEPGAFRTNYAGTYLAMAATTIADYQQTSGKLRTGITARHGSQPGDPDRGSRIILETLGSQAPPLRLVLGALAADLVRDTLQSRISELETWRAAALGADYPADLQLPQAAPPSIHRAGQLNHEPDQS
jgi:NADP-dependent 3-hydroxy acid dehydrogenase YdfG